MNFTIYTLGDLSSMTAMLNAVAMVFNDPIFNDSGALGGSAVRLMFLAVLAAVLLAGMTTMWRNGKGSPIIMLTMFVLWTSLGYTKATVTVVDIYSGSATTVDNVPLLVAVPGGVFTEIGQSLGEKMQTAFSSADATAPALSTTGFVNPLTYILSLRRIMASGMQPHVYNSLRYYAADCVLASDQASSDIFESHRTLHDLIDDDTFHDGFTSVFTNAYPRGTLASCLEASGYLKDNMTAWASLPYAAPANDMLKAGMGSNILRGAGEMGKAAVLSNGGGLGGAAVVAPTSADASNVGQVLLDALGRTAAATASDVAEISASLAFLPGFSDGLMCGTPTPGITMADVNTCSLMSSDQDELARLIESARGGGFGRVAISSMSVFQAIWIALAPLIMLTILAHGPRGPQIFGAYLLLGLWVVSWLPVAYMVNYYIDLSFRQSVAQLGGSGATFNLSQVYSLYRVSADKISVASDLMGAVPVLTMAVLTGSIYAMTKVAGTTMPRPEGFNAHAGHQSAAAQQQPLVATLGSFHMAGHRMDLARTGVAPLTYNVGDAASQSVSSAQETVRAAEAAHSVVKETAFKEMLKSGKVDGHSNRFGSTVERAYRSAAESSSQFVKDIGKSTAFTEAEKADFLANVNAQAKVGVGGVVTSEGIDAALRNTKSISADRQSKILSDLKGSDAYKRLDSAQRSAAASLGTEDVSSLEAGHALEAGTAKAFADTTKKVESARESLTSAELLQKTASNQRSLDTANLRREIMANEALRYPLQGLNQAVISGDKPAISRFFFGNDGKDHSQDVDRFLGHYGATRSEVARINPGEMNEEGWRGVIAMHAALSAGLAGQGDMRTVTGGQIAGKPSVSVDTREVNRKAVVGVEGDLNKIAAMTPAQFNAWSSEALGGARTFSYADLDRRAIAAATRAGIDPNDTEAHVGLKKQLLRVEMERKQVEADFQRDGVAVDGGKRYGMTKGLVAMSEEAVGDLAIFNAEMAKEHPVLFGVAVADMAVGTAVSAVGRVGQVAKMARGGKPPPKPTSMTEEVKQLGAQQEGKITRQQADEIFKRWNGGDVVGGVAGSRAWVVPGKASASAIVAGVGAGALATAVSRNSSAAPPPVLASSVTKPARDHATSQPETLVSRAAQSRPLSPVTQVRDEAADSSPWLVAPGNVQVAAVSAAQSPRRSEKGDSAKPQVSQNGPGADGASGPEPIERAEPLQAEAPPVRHAVVIAAAERSREPVEPPKPDAAPLAAQAMERIDAVAVETQPATQSVPRAEAAPVVTTLAPAQVEEPEPALPPAARAIPVTQDDRVLQVGQRDEPTLERNAAAAASSDTIARIEQVAMTVETAAARADSAASHAVSAADRAAAASSRPHRGATAPAKSESNTLTPVASGGHRTMRDVVERRDARPSGGGRKSVVEKS